MSVNQVILVGRIGTDPEIHNFDDGGAVVNLPLATNRSWTNRETQERQEETEWHQLVFRNQLAKVVQEHIRKGSQLFIRGRLKQRKYTDKDSVERYTTDIIVDEMTMLGSRPTTDAAAPAPADVPAEPPADAPAKDSKPKRRRSTRTKKTDE